MKKYILLLLVLPFVFSCDKDENSNNNPYLPNYNFSLDINMELISYQELMYPSNPVYIGQAGIGINGIIVMNTGNSFVAFEASCPNQQLSACSVINEDDLNGVNAVCPCDQVQYSLFTGLPTTPAEYSLKPYRVEQLSSTMIRVYN